ncbi:hypothetical protein PL263_07640 [Methylomonas sp. EFPC3]|uniref:hypothetical protein n=1 Tax=Methylomonas sp. EFPC3 TaxID=3021710 RepID=UPI002415EB81|nr:hypothetical protein [Methylomonas sp. EFPC3]WFP51895.1 hypothetical protein PL263_07640 [Methylomonas sp. EFPC3]
MPFRITHYTRPSLVLLCCWQWLLMGICAGFACSVQASKYLPAFELANPAYQYDGQGRTINHTSPLGNFEQSYLGETGKLTAQTLSGTAIGSQWQYDGNPNDRRLTGIVNSGASRRYDYVTTANNIISQIQETGPAAVPKQTKRWNYAYDAADRLLQADASDGSQYRYAYDAGDNLTDIATPTAGTALTVNSVNQISSANGVACSYDANGKLTDDGIRTYQWDAGNRLLKICFKANAQATWQDVAHCGQPLTWRNDSAAFLTALAQLAIEPK